jgi:predicted PurR-regulated permease PerM
MTDARAPADPPPAAPAAPAPPLACTLWRIFWAAVLLALLWRLRAGVMLIFGAVLVAATLNALAQPIARHTRLPGSVAVGGVLVLLVLLLAGAFWWIGQPLGDQLDALRAQLPKAWAALQGWLQRMPLIQQLEGNLLVPLIQRWAVKLPPALGVGSVIVFASPFGLLGVVFGSPLIIVTMILVKKLYVEDALERR